MGPKIFLAGLIIVSVCCVPTLAVSASTPKPKVNSFSPTTGIAGTTEVTIKGTNLADATKVTFNGKRAGVISDTTSKIKVTVPADATTGYIKVKTAGGTATSVTEFTVLDSTATATTPGSSSILVGNANSDTAVVSGNATYGSPTGTVTFYECGPTQSPEPCTSRANQVGSPVGVTTGGNDSSSATSVSYTPSSIGYWCFSAYYSGDSNYAASSDTTTDGCFYTMPGTVPSATATTAASSSISIGNANSDTAVVSGNATYGSPTGTVTFYECGPTESPEPCTSQVDQVGTPVAVNTGDSDTSSATSVSFTPTSSGYWCFAGYYSGDSNYAASSDTTTDACFFVQPFDDATSVVSAGGGSGYCSLLTSGGVDCWGQDSDGELGDGSFSESAVPVAVVGVGGSGTLTGATNLVADSDAYCSLLSSGGVDCWGRGYNGDLGNGIYYTTGQEGSATPVEVEGVGGSGKLTGVASLVGNSEGFCAVLSSGGVDCWGKGNYGELGNGIFYTTGNEGSATPVEVEGVGGSGKLTGVASLVAVGGTTYCALLASGGVDCWGKGYYGELGNGIFYTTGKEGSATPVEVEGVGGTGTLTGVTNLIGGAGGTTYCALLTSSGVDCWGFGATGELGNGIYYTTGNEGSATPVEVEGVGGAGTLGGATSLAGDSDGNCAVLSSGGVDCWGYGFYGELGNGTFSQTAVPVAVVDVGGSGTLTDVTSLGSDGETYCALLSSSGVDCWGEGAAGELGNGIFYSTGNEGSATPVEVEGVGAAGTLSAVSSVASDSDGSCALLTSGGAYCWGYGYYGELGDGTFYTTSPYGSATPVEVG
jgi:alpha-tubulin suppressor-like RCC1 family protein